MKTDADFVVTGGGNAGCATSDDKVGIITNLDFSVVQCSETQYLEISALSRSVQ